MDDPKTATESLRARLAPLSPEDHLEVSSAAVLAMLGEPVPAWIAGVEPDEDHCPWCGSRGAVDADGEIGPGYRCCTVYGANEQHRTTTCRKREREHLVAELTRLRMVHDALLKVCRMVLSRTGAMRGLAVVRGGKGAVPLSLTAEQYTALFDAIVLAEKTDTRSPE